MNRIDFLSYPQEVSRWSQEQGALVEKKEEITTHVAWHGKLSGMKCEEVLRGQSAGSYVIRQGESEDEYYLSWIVDTEKNIYRHQPFCISNNLGSAKWIYRNCVTVAEQTLEDIIPVMMNQAKEKCLPFHSR